MTLVVDANVAVRWFVAGEHRRQALAVAASGEELIAPGLFVSEVANTAFKLMRDGNLPRLFAEDLARRAEAAMSDLMEVRGLHDEAFALCLDLRHPIYDCYYLALARRESASLVTADRRFTAKLQGTPHARHVVHLADYVP